MVKVDEEFKCQTQIEFMMPYLGNKYVLLELPSLKNHELLYKFLILFLMNCL